jgi:hypothetical protein
MKKISAIICLFLILSNPVFAAPPSDASLNQLITLTDMKQMMGGVFDQVDGLMNDVIQQSLKDQKVTKAQQLAIDNMKTKMVSLLKKEYGWELLEPKFMQIYRDSFTQEEVDGMIVFYQSPSGQAVIKKMPVVMQQAITMSQSMIQALAPKMQKIQQEFTAEMKAAEHK